MFSRSNWLWWRHFKKTPCSFLARFSFFMKSCSSSNRVAYLLTPFLYAACFTMDYFSRSNLVSSLSITKHISKRFHADVCCIYFLICWMSFRCNVLSSPVAHCRKFELLLLLLLLLILLLSMYTYTVVILLENSNKLSFTSAISLCERFLKCIG